jgi:catechol 2,3-dioxygenase-like lactoylglutathione lyase family enzyme
VSVELGGPAWVGIVAEDLEVQRAFYRDVLGLEEVRERDGYVWFRLGEGTLEVAQRSVYHPELRRAGTAVGYRVEDVAAAREELISGGVEPLTEIQGGPKAGALWCYFRDPEGNTFQITQELAG